jgi:hypothetical protein
MTALASGTYRVEGVDTSSGDVKGEVVVRREKGTDVCSGRSHWATGKKVAGVYADRYSTDLSVVVKRGDQPVPQVKITVGPSIGDQGVVHHTFYSVAPEAVSYVNGKLERHPAASINANKNSPDHLVTNWSG